MPIPSGSDLHPTDKDLTDLANMFNPIMRSWIAYYGRFYPSALTSVFRPLDFALARWAERKNKKRIKGHTWRAWRWLQAVMRRELSLFAHWALLRDNNGRTIGAV